MIEKGEQLATILFSAWTTFNRVSASIPVYFIVQYKKGDGWEIFPVVFDDLPLNERTELLHISR
jgi:hypothetical protein